MKKLSGSGLIAVWDKLLFLHHEGIYSLPKTDDELSSVMFVSVLGYEAFRHFSHEKHYYVFQTADGYYELYGMISNITMPDTITVTDDDRILYDVTLSGICRLFRD